MLSLVGSGVVISRARARLCGALVVATGLVLAAAGLAESVGATAAPHLLNGALALVMPLAVVAYPRLRWRQPHRLLRPRAGPGRGHRGDRLPR